MKRDRKEETQALKDLNRSVLRAIEHLVIVLQYPTIAKREAKTAATEISRALAAAEILDPEDK